MRDGAWSGNAIDSLSNVARGSRRRAMRSTVIRTTVDIARIISHQPTSAAVVDGRVMTRLSTAPAATEAAIGTAMATNRTASAAAGRLRHLLPAGLCASEVAV